MSPDRLRHLRKWLGASTALVAFAAPEAYAQTAASSGAPVEEVVVTGSRIRQPNLVSNAPVNVVSSQELKLEGVARVEDLLNKQPQVFAAQASTVNNGSTGTATIDLRGLGSGRTLVLVDGKRLVTGDVTTTFPSADVNMIPSAFIDRIDVLTLGAAATYGSDAVAGVVNFIMKKNFEGVMVDSQFSFNEHGNKNKGIEALIAARGFPPVKSTVTNGNEYSEAVMIGTNSENGKGNVTLFAQYHYNQGIFQGDYDYSDCQLSETGARSFGCAGSSTTAPARIVLLNAAGKTSANYTPTNATGGTRPYVGGTDAFNFAPYNYFQRPDERYNVGGSAHYQIAKYADVYTDFMFMDDNSPQLVAPSGVFFGAPLFQVNCGNPFFQQETAVYASACPAGSTPTTNVTTEIGRRAVETAGRIANYRHDQYRLDVGVRGDLTDAWSYDVYGQYGTMIYSNLQTGYFANSRIQKALQVVNVNGTPTCLSVVNGTDGACRPLNVFTTAPISGDALNYLTTNALFQGQTREIISEGQINGDLGKYGVRSPLATNSVKIVFGGGYRREELTYQPDQTALGGDLAGAGGASVATRGDFEVREGFFEVALPIIGDKPFVKDLTIDGQYRYSDYSTGVTTDTFNVELGYSPTSDVKFRVDFAHAVRAASINELFTPQRLALFGGADPCAGPTPAASAANCAFAGVTAAQYRNVQQCIANQCQQLIGGNPLLQPESSDTKTFGIVATPTFLPGFNATVDYFDTKINNLISAGIAPGTILSQCIATHNPVYCGAIHRDPTLGTIWLTGATNATSGYINGTTVNTGSLQEKGVDFEANYRRDLDDLGFPIKGAGDITINFSGTYLANYVVEPVVGLGKYDCAGYYGLICGSFDTVNPLNKWRHFARMTWGTPWDVALSFAWRHFSSVKLDANSSNAFLNGAGPDLVNTHLASYDYFDISGNWAINDRITFRAGINNVFDKDPPLVTSDQLFSATGGNTFPSVYDSLGRHIFMGITLNF